MPLLSDYADSAHRLGMHLKMYYTLGQVSPFCQTQTAFTVTADHLGSRHRLGSPVR